ncbi:hypothetical protein QNI16_27855 [Cytophagaceae bacterium YF14B1]|uniref:Uncharacterized protein n=1 Tax=Xanthocytophaga flava TaxID=3048013 RepID=A0AAE3QX21_9BACT|nr:hypothetical protein [Xanthocytophaga flavus]MDJ1484344.1 hypothetical protein [Xanthocytophaga flavus]
MKEKLPDLFEGRRVQYVPHIGLNSNISKKTKEFLCTVGLPMLGFDYPLQFLPQTFIQSVDVQGDIHYILGDISLSVPGSQFISVKENEDTVYYLHRSHRDNKVVFKTPQYLSSDLYLHDFFLIHFCSFVKKFGDKWKQGIKIDKEEIRSDYENLKQILTQKDEKAMSPELMWGDQVAYLQVSFAEHLFDDDLDNLTDETE